MKYVIVGAGPAGVIAAETLRKADPSGDIVLLGDEPEPPYSRMAIPYYLTGGIDEAGTYIRKTPNHYDDLAIRYVQGRATKVGAGGLATEDGGDIEFDRLLVATGASPLDPPVDGLDSSAVHHCWTLEDARNIIELAGVGSRVVLMGAGFIGCIILESLVERGVALTVVEAEDRMLPRMMDKPGADMIKAWCEGKGITVLTSTRIKAIEPAPAGVRVHFEGGGDVPADLVVVATGVGSNTGFLEGSGVKVEEGIVVDDRLKSTQDAIYAAGDCAQGPDQMGGWSVHAIQPTAAEHGRVAALNMAGRDTPYKGSLNMNVLNTAGLVSCSFGLWDGVKGGTSAESLDREASKYIRLEFQDDHLVGALTLGRTDFVGVLRGLIQGRIPLGPWKDKLTDNPHRIMEAYLASTMA
ncbi:MAG: FAD-dependent oxidoreductase [Proteobacteria bacterium]|nr:FAD-dependent oxidoreductase [Pseudomonadota bacterium]